MRGLVRGESLDHEIRSGSESLSEEALQIAREEVDDNDE